MERGVSLFIDPSGAQTGGRVVKRELKEIGQAAVTAQSQIKDLSDAQIEMARSAQSSAQALFAQQDALRAKFNPTFAVIQRFKTVQDEIRHAHSLGAISTNEMTNAISRERQATLSAIQAIKGHTAAVITDNGAMRAASFQRRNLIFQLNDIAVSLASGMNPLMVMAQQGSQIGQIYMGQGGVTTALRETASMAGAMASKFRVGGIAGAVASALIVNGLSTIREEASKTLQATVTWGEVLSATLGEIAERLQSAFGPSITTYIVDPVLYALDKLASATTDFIEWGIGGWKIFFRDVGFLWDNFPDIVGAAFVGAVNIAVEQLNSLVKRNADAIDQIIRAFNKIPGVKIPTIDAPEQSITPFANPYSDRLSNAWAIHEQGTRDLIKNNSPIRGFGEDVVDRIGTNRAQSRLADLANMDFGKSIQGATGLGQAVNGIATAAQQAGTTVIDVNQQMMDGRRQTLIAFEQSGKQLRNMKQELIDIQATLAQAGKTPVSDVFGDLMSEKAAGSIDAAASSIGKVFSALNEGRLTAQGAHEALEMIRAALIGLGGDREKVNAWVDSIINANIHMGNLASGIKQADAAAKGLANSIMGIPNRVISIGIQQYTVGATGGGTKGINVYGGGADFSSAQYDVGGGKTVGVYGGNGAVTTTGYLVGRDEIQGMYDDLGYARPIDGARAAGGPVAGGKQYLVGEKGPELVTMGGAGTVTNANSTASILSGGRDTLSLIEDHLYSIMQELRIHTGYWETAESNALEMITCLQAIKSVQSSSSSYSGGSSSSSRSSGGSYGSSSSGNSVTDPMSPYYFNARSANLYGSGAKYSPVADALLNGNVGALNGVGGGFSEGISNALGLMNKTMNTPSLLDRLKTQLGVGFATGGQIMAGEDQRVEFFKKNTERVIIVDDSKVSDGRGGGRQQKAERPVSLVVNFNGGVAADKRSQQAQADEIRRVVQQAMRS